MKKKTPVQKFRAAERAHKRTRDDLQHATFMAFPPGTIIKVRIGRAYITGRVISSGHWFRATEIAIKNQKSGVCRNIDISKHAFRIIKPGDVTRTWIE